LTLQRYAIIFNNRDETFLINSFGKSDRGYKWAKK